jgi:hypothetical protein
VESKRWPDAHRQSDCPVDLSNSEMRWSALQAGQASRLPVIVSKEETSPAGFFQRRRFWSMYPSISALPALLHADGK